DVLDAVAQFLSDQLAFGGGLAGFVDLGARADPAHDAAALVAHGQRPAQHPAIIAAAVAQAIFDLEGLAGLERMLPGGLDAVAVLGVIEIFPAGGVGGIFGDAGEFFPARIVIVI